MTTSARAVHRELDAGDGLTIHVAESGTGPPLILLHGFTGSAETWRPLRPLLDVACRVIAVDQPGHGRSSSPSDPSRYRLARFAADLAVVLDLLQVERAVLLGYSMGARAALRFAVDHPDRVAGLVLESASPGMNDEKARSDRRESDRALARDIELHGVAKFVHSWETLPLWDSQKKLAAPVRDELHQQRLSNNPAGLANSLRGAGSGEEPSILESAARIAAPTLLIAGSLDRKYVELGNLLQAAIPRSRLEIIADSGHSTHLEQPDAFASATLAFLSTVPSAGSRWT